MKLIPILTALAGGTGTYFAIRNSNVPTPIKYGSAIAVGGISYVIGKRIDKLINPPPGAETVELTKTETEQILKNNSKLPPDQQTRASYSPSEMKTFADKLEKAMAGVGTDEDAVSDVMKKMNNDLDILLLIQSFGVRDDENLTEWLNGDGVAELSNKILATKTKITKTF